MWIRFCCLGIVSLAVLGTGRATSGQEPSTATSPERSSRTLTVATRHVPPFAMRDEQGNWSGIAIELMREVLVELNDNPETEYRLAFRDMPLKEMLTAVEQGSVDLAVAAITVNYERETTMDFSHAFHTSGLGIAVALERRSGWFSVLDRVFSMTLLKVIGGLLVLLLFSGIVIYSLERRSNREQFGGSIWRGIGAGVWWSIVTLTTVGYGDKAPRTFAGRFIAIVWMLSGLLIISSFTAAVTAALTVGELRSRVAGPADLGRVRVATIADSTSESYLRTRHVRHRAFPDVSSALSALSRGEYDAVVYDAPLLRYQVLQDHTDLRVISATFEQQDYAIGMPSGSPLREPVNLAVLRTISQPSWDDVLTDYLGQP